MTEKTRKILVVDDNLAGKYAALLRKKGDVTAATSYRAMLDALENGSYDVISLDNQFPEADGREPEANGNRAAEHIRKRYPGVKLIGMSRNSADFYNSYFDGVFGKLETDPLSYREAITGEQEKVSGDEIAIVASEPIGMATVPFFKDILGMKPPEIIGDNPKRSKLQKYDGGIIIAYINDDFYKINSELWDYSPRGHGHEIIPMSNDDPIAPRIIRLSFDTKNLGKWDVPFSKMIGIKQKIDNAIRGV